MNFVYIDKTNKITDEDIKNDLLHVMNDVLKKNKIMLREYLLYGKYGTKAIKNHFGTWNNLLKEVNIDINRTVEHLSKEDIFLIIEELWIQLGRQPNLSDFESITHHTKKIIISNFSKWSICLQEFVKWENNKKDHPIFKSGDNIKHLTPREPSKSLRYDVLTRDHYKCVICGRSPATDPSVTLHVDHIVPYSLGGETILDNLQTLCEECNLGKSNKHHH